MVNFEIVDENTNFNLNETWISSTKFNTKNTIVKLNGREYRIIAKKERELSGWERFGRIFLGAIALIFSLSSLWLLKSVQKLFTKQKETIRYAVLCQVSDRQEKETIRLVTTKINQLTCAIPQKVKSTLDELFKESLYTIDTLPTYPKAGAELREFDRELMTAPVMKGVSFQGKPFIAIKVEHTITQKSLDDINKTPFGKKLSFKIDDKIGSYVILAQESTQFELEWSQSKNSSTLISPEFFNRMITSSTTGAVHTEELAKFNEIKELLKGNSATDINNNSWKLSL